MKYSKRRFGNEGVPSVTCEALSQTFLSEMDPTVLLFLIAILPFAFINIAYIWGKKQK